MRGLTYADCTELDVLLVLCGQAHGRPSTNKEYDPTARLIGGCLDTNTDDISSCEMTPN